MAKLAEAAKTFEQFKGAVAKDDLSTAKRLLTTLKLKLTELAAPPPVYERTPTAQQELLLAREVLEQAVLLSVRLQDEAAFERNFTQLKTYYTDTRSLLPASKAEALTTGLNLMRLLVQNRIAEFHTELEVLPEEAHASGDVQHAELLERWLMEGAYNKVLAARDSMPDPAYGYFMQRLLTTVREEIAGCSERAYESLSVADARKLMLFPSDQEATQFATERGWEVKEGRVLFGGMEAEGRAAELPSVELIGHALTYARELERIV